ncbi:MAG TPA: glutathione S-transferase family protein [Sneathiellales bacterium]|nr:glutathione S-transferase family protein [Sneathiellales bacterium]
MGLLVDGKWTEEEVNYGKRSEKGEYQRANSVVRDWVTADGAPGPSGNGGFKAEPGRYHLYVAINCPWAHRTMMVRHLKGLEDIVGMSQTSPVRDDQGWVFLNDEDRFRDDLFGFDHLHQVYTRSDPGFTGRVTVPALWDKERKVLVNNESSEIIRMFNSAFDGVGASGPELYPENLRAEIDEINDVVYSNFNNGVYRSGFATTQEAYEKAVGGVFDTLDLLEERLSTTRFLVGDAPTEADWRLFPTLVRFDVAYHSAFKCNNKRIVDYPNLWAYTRELYQSPGIAETVDLDTYRRGYHSASVVRNPLGIVPLGPDLDFNEPIGPRP